MPDDPKPPVDGAAPPADPVTPPADPPPADPPADPAPPAGGDPPADPAKPGDPPPADPASGAPEAYSLKLPENTLLDDDALAFVEHEARALGLTNEQAQSLVESRHQAISEMAAEFLAEAQADPQLGGAKWDQTLKDAREGLNFMFNDPNDAEELRSLLNKTGFGNHKLLMRGFARIGRLRSEDPTTAGRGGSRPATRSHADVFYGEQK